MNPISRHRAIFLAYFGMIALLLLTSLFSPGFLSGSHLRSMTVLAAFIGIVAAGVQGGLIRPLSKRFSESSLIRTGTAIQALAFAAIAASPSYGRPMLYAAGALLALGNGMTQPSVGAFVSKRADPRAQGETLGTNQSAASLARMFGPSLGGWLYGSFGPRSPYLIGAIGMAIAMLVAFGLDRRTPGTTVPADPPV